MMEENRALNAEEVAIKLKIAKNTVYDLIKRGELRSYRVGRKVRIDLADLEAYINQGKTETGDRPLSQQNSNFVISGLDRLLDIIANLLSNHREGVPTLRSYVGSFQGLIALYYDQVQIVAIHLWDSDTDEYNVPYVRRLVPGIPCVIIHLAKRKQGFYVQKGNPKNILSWVCLTRDDVTMVNREKGSGTRVLLDEMLRRKQIKPQEIKGYYNEKTSHLAVANAVATGSCDVAIGSEAGGLGVDNTEFIPLKTESYDLVIKKENLNNPTYRLVYDIICSSEFKESISYMSGYDFSGLGQIIAET